MSGEAASRAHLDLPGNQQQLLKAVVATGKPVCPACFLRPAAGPRLGRSACPAIIEVIGSRGSRLDPQLPALCSEM